MPESQNVVDLLRPHARVFDSKRTPGTVLMFATRGMPYAGRYSREKKKPSASGYAHQNSDAAVRISFGT